MNHLLLILLGFVWGSSFILMKKGLEVFPPDQIAALRLLISCITLLPFIALRINKLSWKIIVFILISGVVGSGLPSYLFPLAQTQIDSAIAGILNSLTPFFTLILGVSVFKFRVSMKNIAGVIIGFAGATVLLISNSNGSFDNNIWFAFLVIFASFCYAVNTNFIKTFLQDIPPLTIASGSFLLLGPFSAIYLSTTDFLDLMQNNGHAWKALFYIAILAVIGTALALIVFNRILQKTRPVTAASVTYLIPLFAVFWGLIDGEKLNILHFFAMLLIVSGIYLTRHNPYSVEPEKMNEKS